MPGATTTIAACLIVRNEQERIGGCLRSVVDAVDQVVVYDTGSADDTMTIARAYGAVVIEGSFNDDFAAARNAALGFVTADWVLSVDADEIVQHHELRAAVAAAPAALDGFGVLINQAGGGYDHRAVKLFRRAGVGWSGRVHERPVCLDGGELRFEAVAADIIRLVHSGYNDPATARAKSERNVRIGLTELDELATGPAGPLSRVLLDLGRSLLGCERRQQAIDVFQAVRGLAPAGPAVARADWAGTDCPGTEWVQATDFLTKMALAAGQLEDALALVPQLRAGGAAGSYCDWLEAQALASLGYTAAANQLLAGITELVDPAGRRHSVEQLREFKFLVDELAALAA